MKREEELSITCVKVVVKKREKIRVQRSVVYMTKNRGPRTDPWKTPQEEVWKDERLSSHLTRKERDDKKDLNQLKTEPCIPNQDEM